MVRDGIGMGPNNESGRIHTLPDEKSTGED